MTPEKLHEILKRYELVEDEPAVCVDCDTWRRIEEAAREISQEDRLSFMTGDLDAVSR